MKAGVHTGTFRVHVLEIVGNAIVGGVEKYVDNLVRYLPDQGFRVTVVTPYESKVTARLRELGSQIFVVHMDNDPPWRSIQFLAELVHYQQVDLIHAHLPKAHVLAGLVGCLTETPVVATIHGMEVNAAELGIRRTTGTRLTVVCQAAYAHALAMGVPEDRVTLIQNGVDLKDFKPHRKASRFKRENALPEDVPLVGFVGRLAFEKGPDVFVQAAQHIHVSAPDVHFVMVGDGPMRPEIESQIQAAGLQPVFHLTGVWDSMPEVYPALDILVQTSRVEGMPFTLLEGMACGLPVAAINAGGVPEVVEVGTTGFLSAQGDWAGLGDAVLKLIRQPELRKEFGAAARHRAETRYDLEQSMENLGQEFRKIMECTDAAKQ